jgi:septum formation protein
VPFVLASASPRRAELLTAAGFDFDVMPADVDETPLPDEEPRAYALRVARAKELDQMLVLKIADYHLVG